MGAGPWTDAHLRQSGNSALASELEEFVAETQVETLMTVRFIMRSAY